MLHLAVLALLAASADPFRPEGIVPAGPFAGLSVDVDKARPARLLTPEEAAPYGIEDGEIAVANVQHADRWWVARIPPGGVAEVIFHQEHIPDGLGHGQLRLRFKAGLWPVLVPQTPEEGLEPIPMSDFVFTADGIPPVGVAGPRKPGPLKQYPIYYRLQSLPQNLLIISGSGTMHSVDQYRIPITDAEKQSVLAEALETATEAGDHTLFSLASRSCVTEALGVLDRALPYPFPNRFIIDRFKPIPKLPQAIPFYLFERGLLRPGTKLANLRDEFPATIE
ncbi:MAG: hypothetical protein HY553_00475 [Elusimicrobia bacterium]|nr:hypothetical protein [Elusimicrobiota bacterium]